MIHITDIVAFVLRHIRILLFIPFFTGVGFAVLFLLAGRPYSSQSAFALATSATSMSRIAGLAAQFGMSFGNRPAESVDFYGVLLKSGDVLREAILSEYAVPDPNEPTDTIRGNLLELMEIKGKTEERRMKNAVRGLRKSVGVSTDMFAGTVSLKVTNPDPDLAEQINRRLLQIVDSYNVGRRKQMAAEEREFFDDRVQESRQELFEAEEELVAFMAENRAYTSSPALQAEASRLRSRVDLRQQVYISLMQAYDQARIDEMRGTPTISVIETPEGSARPAMRILVVLMVGALFGGLCALMIAGFIEFISYQRLRAPDRYRELEVLWRTALRRILIPFGG